MESPLTVEDFVNVCAWCGALRRLPFDLRSNFVCEDAGFSCQQGADEDEELFGNAGGSRHGVT